MSRPGAPLASALALSGVLHAAAAIWLPDFAGRVRARPPSVLTVTIATPVFPAATQASVQPAPEIEPSHVQESRAAVEKAPRRRAAAARLSSPRAPIARGHAPDAPPRADPAPAPPLAQRVDERGGDPANPMADGTRTAAQQSQAALRAAPDAGSATALARSGVGYLDNRQPEYPAVARRLRLEGTVVLRVLVGTDGLPHEYRLRESSGATILDESALRAVSGWRFVAAREGGEAVARWVDVPIRFRLQDGGTHATNVRIR